MSSTYHLAPCSEQPRPVEAPNAGGAEGNGQPAPAATVYFFEGCDFETFPAGGQLAMARSLIKIYGSQLALVGMCRGDVPTGRWVKKELNGISFWFFAVCRSDLTAKRPLVPARLTFYLGLQRFRKAILALGCRNALIQAPEALLAVWHWKLASICFLFPGVENPLRISRYGWARQVSPLFERAMFAALRRVDVIVASADEVAIRRLVDRSGGRLRRERIMQLPTCVDLGEFCPSSMAQAREALGILPERLVLATCGRIGQFKGWDLLLETLEVLRRCRPDTLLVFVGDGEERPRLEASIAAKRLDGNVLVTGFQSPARVAKYLNAADAVVFGSCAEGWSVAMLEALACGKPMVSTDVSGAGEMIAEERNGFVLRRRDPVEFSAAIERALALPDAGQVSRLIAARFGHRGVEEGLGRLWAPLRRTVLEMPPPKGA